MPKLTPIVKAIKDEMVRQEINAAGLARGAGLSVANVYDVLRGDVQPSMKTVVAMAKAVNLKFTVGKR